MSDVSKMTNEQLADHMAMVIHDLLDEECKICAEATRRLRDSAQNAERYVFLRNHLYTQDQVSVGEAFVTMKVVGNCPTRGEFDAAIDHARAAQGEK